MRRTVTHDLEHAFFGDLICPTDFKFSVECKHYKAGPTFAAIAKGKITQWDEWIGQAKQDAVNSKKLMMLIMKYNGVDELVFLEDEAHEVLGLTLVFPYKGVYGYRLEDFLTLSDDHFFNYGLVKQQSLPAAQGYRQ